MKKQTISFLLASLLFCAPLSGCGANDESGDLTEDIPARPVQPADPSPEEPPLLEEDPPIEETPPVAEDPPATETPPAIETPPVVETPPVIETPKNEAKYIRILYTGLNIRSGPATSNSSYGTLEEGTCYPYLGSKDGWYKTTYKGKTAYVSSNESYTALLTMQKADDKVETVIEKGLECLGVKYVYGAVRLHDGKGNLNKSFTTTKFDCSSLIQYVFYYGADVLLDVTTRTQVVQGKKVARADIRRGDCIYFTNSSRVNKTGIERVGHVALYLGDNYILHTASDYCKIEKISQTRWNYYIETRRFI